MLSPKRTKYRKSHKGTLHGRSKGGNTVSFGDFGLQVLEPGWITARQIEAARIAISRTVKRVGKLYIRVFPDKSVSKKPAEVRMGAGKGNVEMWVAVAKPGKILFEIEGVPLDLAKEAFLRAHHKLPLRTQLVTREPVL